MDYAIKTNNTHQIRLFMEDEINNDMRNVGVHEKIEEVLEEHEYDNT